MAVHDVRVWAVRGSKRDLKRIRPKLEGLIEGDKHGVHLERDVLEGPHAVLYAEAVRSAIDSLPRAPQSSSAGLNARTAERSRWRWRRGGPPPKPREHGGN